jgi:tetratricopeptide (TPR) repeat protein
MNIRTGRIAVLLSAAVIVAVIAAGCAKKPAPDEHMLVQEGIQSFQQGKYEKALDNFNKAIEADPKDAEAHFFKANALTLMGKKQEAITEYDKSIQIAPDVPQTYFNKGNALADLGRDKEAVAAYDMAIAKNPTYVKAYYNKAMILSRMGRTKESQEVLLKARSLAPAPPQSGEQLPPGHPVPPGLPGQPPQGAAPGK